MEFSDMLQKLNERLQGIVAWVIVSIVAITFTLFGIEYYVQSHQGSDQIVLEVNGSPITKEMVHARLERARRIFEGQSGFNEKSFRQKVIDDLVDAKIAAQSAQRSGFYVGRTSVEQAIFHLPDFSENGRFSPGRYQQILSTALYTNEEFQAELLQEMLIQQERFAFLATEFTLPNELLTYVEKAYQTRGYRYLEIPTRLFSKETGVTQDEVQSYYDAHSNDFNSPEAVSLAYVRLSMPEIKKKITLAPEDVAQYYRENQQSFIQDGKVKALDEVKQQIQTQLLLEKAQLEYARLLETLSEMSYQNTDELETTAKALGLKVEETELFTRTGGKTPLTQNPHVIRLAFSDPLLIAGENSNPLQLDSETVVVFRVLTHESAKPLSLEAVKSKIETILLGQKAEEAASRLGALLLKANKDQQTQLLAKYKLVWHEVPASLRQASTPDSSIHEFAFSLNNLGERAGKILTLPTGQAYVLLELKEVSQGNLKDLPENKKSDLLKHLSLQRGEATYNAYFSGIKTASSIKK